MKLPGLRRCLWVLAGVVTAVCVIWIFGFRKSPSAFQPLPQPNGYDALTHAAARLHPMPDGWPNLDTPTLAKLVGSNQVQISELRRALAIPGSVPVQMSEAWLSVRSTNFSRLANAAGTLLIDASLRRRLGDTNAAMQLALDCMRLGTAILHGGLLSDYMVGASCEYMGANHLSNLLGGLTAAECRQAVRAMEEQDARRDTIQEMLRREREWRRRTYGVGVRVRRAIQRRTLNLNAELNAKIPLVEAEFANRALLIRQQLLRLAARAYTLEHGTAPTNAAALVPDYLKAVPLDPTTGNPLDLLPEP